MSSQGGAGRHSIFFHIKRDRWYDRIIVWWMEGHRVVPDRWLRKPNEDLNWLAHALNAYHRWTRWARPSFWFGYVFAPYNTVWQWPYGKKYRVPSYDRATWNPRDHMKVWWPRVIWCRLRGHDRIIYYSSGLEPDNRCRRCLEEIA